MIPTSSSDLIVAHGTHPGETGKNNEDQHAVAYFRTETGENVTLGIIADGIGGHRAGEVASELAVQTLIDTVAQNSVSDYRAALEQAMGLAARLVAERAQADPQFHGMGTTCVAALVAGRRLYSSYIGDSRLYLARNGTIRQTTVDHTWVQEALDLNLLTREDIKTHPNRHVVRRHLGGKPDVKPDFRLRLSDTETPEQSEANQGLELKPGDTMLLCSDGLSDLVDGSEILEVLNRQDPQGAVDELIVMARARGGHDNITVVVMRVPA